MTTRNALAAMLRVDTKDPMAMLGAGLLANALINLETVARAHGKKG